MIGPRVGHGHLAPGQAHGGEIRRRHHAVGHDGVARRTQLVDPFDLNP